MLAAAPNSLTGYLQFHAHKRPNVLYSRYIFPDRDPIELTYQDTELRTRQYAALYADHGVGKGSVVLIILPHHEDLMAAFYGATWLGAIPAFLPFPTAKLNGPHYYRNLKLLLTGTRPQVVMTCTDLQNVLFEMISASNAGPTLLVQNDISPEQIYCDPVPQAPEDIAFIQYSSGSTGLQKGAAISHGAVLAELRGVGKFFELTDKDSFLSWVPLYHDWGLVCVALQALEVGSHFTMISPMHWVKRPVVVFELVHKYRSSTYYLPNFAFNYMTKRIRDEEMEGLDLSSIRVCCNGAEPCFYASHQMFAERFVKWNFKPESLSIVYGMAEVTNSVFAAGHKEPIQIDCIDRTRLQTDNRAQPVSDQHPNLLHVLGVGRPLTGTDFKIIDDNHEELPDREVGEVGIKSQAQFQGYYRNPKATAKAVHRGWYLTGDLGYRVGDTLFVTGRKSDLIILGGVNIYPHDVETIVSEHPSVVSGRVAALGIDDLELGTQKLIVIVESRSVHRKVLKDIARYIRTQIPAQLGVVVDEVYHAPYRWIIKTSSGKIARLPNYMRLDELHEGAGKGATNCRSPAPVHASITRTSPVRRGSAMLCKSGKSRAR